MRNTDRPERTYSAKTTEENEQTRKQANDTQNKV